MPVPATRRSWRLLLAALGIGTGAALMGPVLLSGRAFVGRDIVRVYYPLRQYWAERVLAGQFPA